MKTLKQNSKHKKSFRASIGEKQTSIESETKVQKVSPDKAQAAIGLTKILADSYALLIKTHNYHWNATGTGFIGFHNLTEQEYNLLFPAIDDIAEMLRTTGQKVPASLNHFNQLSDIKEPVFTLTLSDMALDLAQSNNHISQEIKIVLPYFEDNKQYDIVDFLVGRMAAHNKAAWLFNSTLEA